MMDLFYKPSVLGNSRYAWIDYAKGICIILVTFRHVQEGLHPAGTMYPYPVLKFLDVFFFSFRMPLFFIVSGIFLGGTLRKKSVTEYIGGRFKTLVWPLLLWGSIQVTLQLIFADYVNVDRKPIDYLNLLIKPRQIEQFWYLHTLFLTGSLYAIMKVWGKFKMFHQFLLGIALYSITGYCRYNAMFEHLFILDIFFYYIFFAVGDYFGSIILDAKNFKIFSSTKTFLIFTPIFVALELYFTQINLAHGIGSGYRQPDYYVQNQLPALFLIVGLVGGAFLIHCSFLLQKLDVLKFIRVVGYYSLHIYVIHLAVTAGTRIFFRHVLGYDNFVVLLIVSTILGIGIPIIIANITERLGMWWLFSLKNPNADKKRVSPVWQTLPGKIAPEEPITDINPQVIQKN
ncbi:MAG: acyltransferase [Chitinophagaceae bacterium]|nr:acyltransferase [Chitinophagaceae bacterium]